MGHLYHGYVSHNQRVKRLFPSNHRLRSSGPTGPTGPWHGWLPRHREPSAGPRALASGKSYGEIMGKSWGSDGFL